MKERWKYGDYEDDTKPFKKHFYRIKQILIWRFYLRVIKKWFTPCKKCQEKIEREWNKGYRLDVDFFEKFIHRATIIMCDCCLREAVKINAETEVILGNNDYDPPIELSRNWVEDDNSLEELTEEQYKNKTK